MQHTKYCSKEAILTAERSSLDEPQLASYQQSLFEVVQEKVEIYSQLAALNVKINFQLF